MLGDFYHVNPVDNGFDRGPPTLPFDNEKLDVIKEAQGIAELIDLSA